ncbi:hypothetical protein [Vibrio astriarenae]|uniref:hypothetical protein n=1 Tax=Vibrio astriarenae TaxID=1481923 RepID=UPI0037350557
MPMVEVINFFSTKRLLPSLNWVSDVAVNAKNLERVQDIQVELEAVVSNNAVGLPLVLTFAVVGKPRIEKRSHQRSNLYYTPASTCIVGNPLGLVAICRLLGQKTFLFSSRLSVKEANQRSELRQRFAMETVEVRVVFDDESGIDEQQVVELFKQNRVFDAPLNLPHINGSEVFLSEDQFPLKLQVEQLTQQANLDFYGGVSSDSRHVKVSDTYITTQYILFKLLVGAVAGIGTQEYSKMSKDVTLPSGQPLSLALSEDCVSQIAIFLSAWLKALKNAFVDDRSGYHLSPQIWQAIGLTFHHINQGTVSNDDLFSAGNALGQLDYSKSAQHWNECSVMELDAKGRVYKNSASSTRLFRAGLCEYFVGVVKRGVTKQV